MAKRKEGSEIGQEIGYGKPPKSTQFKKGKSGNPKGRPKGSKSLSTVLAKMGQKPIKLKINGQLQRTTMVEAIFMQLMNKALSGDTPAMRQFFSTQRFVDETQRAKPSDRLNEVLAAFRAGPVPRGKLNEDEED